MLAHALQMWLNLWSLYTHAHAMPSLKMYMKGHSINCEVYLSKYPWVISVMMNCSNAHSGFYSKNFSFLRQFLFYPLPWVAIYTCCHPIAELHELQKVIGEDAADNFTEHPSEENLKTCFSAMMNSPKDVIESALSDLLQRFSEMGMLVNGC